jgi:multidrug efflux pump subunit AcrB
MRISFTFLAAAFCLAPLACQRPVSAEPESGDPLVIVVNAAYPGANGQVVADTIAVPIEQQINGAEHLFRIESESKNDGSYVARLYFDSTADLKSAVEVVKKRVALAEPTLPELVRRNEVIIKIAEKKKDENRNRMTIAVVDRGEYGFDQLSKLADAVTKRLAKDASLVKPETFPKSQKSPLVRLDRAKCASLQVNPADVYTALMAAGPTATADAVKKLKVKSKRNQFVPLGSIAAIEEVTGPSAIYRVNLYPAIRISGAPPDGNLLTGAAKRAVELAKAELKRLKAKLVTVDDLTAVKSDE